VWTFKFQKVASDDLEYHIASRINNGRWPSSVEFKPKDEFFPSEVRKLRESIKKAVDDLPEGPASQLRTYAVDWILSENV